MLGRRGGLATDVVLAEKLPDMGLRYPLDKRSVNCIVI